MATKLSTKAPTPSLDIFSSMAELVMKAHSDNPHEAYMAKVALYALCAGGAIYIGAIIFEPILNK